MLRLEDLSVGYGDAALLRGVNASLEPGQLVSLTGANGTGKSTLLRVIAGQQPPLRGRVVVDGVPVSSMSAAKKALALSLVYTDRTLAGALRVRELVALGRQPHTGLLGRLSSDDRDIVDDSMRLTGISHKADSYVANLSDGERQKAMIARALAQDSPVMLLDEPTTFLDAASRIDIFALLERLAHDSRRAVLLSTHEISSALSFSDTVWVVDPASRSLAVAAPRQLKEPGSALDAMFADRGIYFDPRTNDFLMRETLKEQPHPR